MKNTLPSINVLPVHSCFLPVIGKKVTFTPYTVKQEGNLAVAKNSNKIEELVLNYEEILKSCVKEEIDFNTLSFIDFVTLIINIRSVSKGESIEMHKKECSNEKCKKSFDFKVNLPKALKYDNVENIKAIVDITDELVFEIVPLKYKFMLSLDSIVKDKKELDEETEMQLFIHTATYSVDKLFYNKDIYTPEPEELKEKVIVNLTRGNLEKIFKKYNELITVYLAIEYVCPHCQHKEEIIEKNFLK